MVDLNSTVENALNTIGKALIAAGPEKMTENGKELNAIVEKAIGQAFPIGSIERIVADRVWTKQRDDLIRRVMKMYSEAVEKKLNKIVPAERRKETIALFTDNAVMTIVPFKPDGERLEKLRHAADTTDKKDYPARNGEVITTFARYLTDLVNAGDAFNLRALVGRAIDELAGKDDTLLVALYCYVAADPTLLVNTIVKGLIDGGDVEKSRSSIEKANAAVEQWNREHGRDATDDLADMLREALKEDANAPKAPEAPKPVKLSNDSCIAIREGLKMVSKIVTAHDGWQNNPELAQFMSIIGAAELNAPKA